jgi:hypothetical protein
MDKAGVARFAADARALASALEELTVPGPERERQIARGRAMFHSDPEAAIIGAASSVRHHPSPA